MKRLCWVQWSQGVRLQSVDEDETSRQGQQEQQLGVLSAAAAAVAAAGQVERPLSRQSTGSDVSGRSDGVPGVQGLGEGWMAAGSGVKVCPSSMYVAGWCYDLDFQRH